VPGHPASGGWPRARTRLVHGSIASGNILIADGAHPASLLDFGCAALVGDGDAAPSADDAAFDRLVDEVRSLASSARSRA
jgi:aminoglycoside phosphotransferase (APT) family kinase protein